MVDNSIDTSSLNLGIIFYQNPDNGEIDFCWDSDDSELCSPSLMPENFEDILDIEEKYFQIMAKELNKRRMENEIEPTKDKKKLKELEEEFDELSDYNSPRDPEREGPVLSEEEEDTVEAAPYRLEHDPIFQDEAGLMYGDNSEGENWPDDEGMDPMENQ